MLCTANPVYNNFRIGRKRYTPKKKKKKKKKKKQPSEHFYVGRATSILNETDKFKAFFIFFGEI